VVTLFINVYKIVHMYSGQFLLYKVFQIVVCTKLNVNIISGVQSEGKVECDYSSKANYVQSNFIEPLRDILIIIFCCVSSYLIK